MKKKTIVSSLLTIVLCLSLIAGSTYALFTSEDEINIAVASGKVNVVATILEDGMKTYSLDEEQAAGKFANGGIADFAITEEDGKVLTLDKMTPGDKVVFAIEITNNSNVAMKYRVAWDVSGELAPALKATADGNSIENGASAWTPWAIPVAEDGSDKVKTIEVVVELPAETGNEYQDKSAKIAFTVEAVQDNAPTPDEWDGTADTSWYNDTDTEFVLDTAEELAGLAELANAGNTFSQKTIVLESDMDLDGNVWTPVKKFAGTLNGNDHTISNFSVDATAGHGGFIETLEWGTVQNLTLSDVTATVGNYRFGVLARSINQSNIDNVTVKNVNVTTTAPTAFVAGLFAHGTVNSNMEVNNCTVENLTVNAEAGAYLIGGITTFVQKNGTEAEGTNIFENLNVKNFKVTVNDTDNVCGVGGLVGQTQSVWQNPRFNNCSVSGLDVVATGTVDVGGFICYPGSWTYAENCTTEGKIDVTGVTSADNCAGGFFGNYGWGDNVGKGDHKVTNCSADVDITTKYASAGGFVGSGTNSEGRNKNITLTNCEAKGTITCVEGGTANIGGFAGQTDRGIYINCSAAQAPFIGKVLDGYTLTDDGNGTLTVTKQ